MKKNWLYPLVLCLFMCGCTTPMAQEYQVSPKALANHSSFALTKEAIGKVYNAHHLRLTYSGAINGRPVSGQADEQTIASAAGQKVKFLLYNLPETLTQNQQKHWENNQAAVSLEANSQEINALVNRFLPNCSIGLKSAYLKLSYHADGRLNTAQLHFSSVQYTGQLNIVFEQISR